MTAVQEEERTEDRAQTTLAGFKSVVEDMFPGLLLAVIIGVVLYSPVLRRDETPNFYTMIGDDVLARTVETMFFTAPVILVASLFVRFYRRLEGLPSLPPEGRQATANRWIVLIGSLIVGAGFMAVLTSDANAFMSSGYADDGDSFQYMLLPWLITLGAYWHLHRLRMENLTSGPPAIIGFTLHGPLGLDEMMMRRKPAPTGDETSVGDDREMRGVVVPPDRPDGMTVDDRGPRSH